ncbi:MAG: preprotein translocase subunit SecG [bacterium]|nr:preprotein translocase subunit SecG [bacterium]
MISLLPHVQLLVAILLIVTILLQQRGSGLGAGFGGDSDVPTTRRGGERRLFLSSIVLAVLFLGLAFLSLAISS